MCHPLRQMIQSAQRRILSFVVLKRFFSHDLLFFCLQRKDNAFNNERNVLTASGYIGVRNICTGEGLFACLEGSASPPLGRAGMLSRCKREAGTFAPIYPC